MKSTFLPPKTKKQFTTDQCGCARGFELKQIIAAVKCIFFNYQKSPIFPKTSVCPPYSFILLWTSSSWYQFWFMWTITLKILKWLLTSVWLPLTWKGQKCKWINPQDELDAEKCCLLQYVLNSSWLPPALKKKKQKAIWHQRKKISRPFSNYWN